MCGSIQLSRLVLSRSLLVLLAGMQLTFLAGCGGMSGGKSNAEQFADRQKALGNSLAGPSGKTALGERSLEGFKQTGWTIDLSGGTVTDATIDKIIEASRSSPVLDLNLSGTAVTDEQLGKLDKAGVFVKTVDLDLSDTKITDAGLDKIETAAVVMNLNIKGSSATQEGAKRLGDRKMKNPSTPPPFKKQPKVTI